MIPVLYCGNDKVFDGILISLLSITKYTAAPLGVYIMTVDLQDINAEYKPVTGAQRSFLESVVRRVNADSFVCLIDVTEQFRSEMLGSPNMITNYTPYTLVRLFADIVSGLPDKILYLDTDTMAHADISPVFDIDIDGYEFAAARDYLGKIFIRYDYQNAGVLLLNLVQIRKTGFFVQVRAFCRTKRMWFPDQTALNRLVPKKKFMSSRYNEQRKLHEDTVIQHFCKSIRLLPFYHTINIKPWEIERLHRIYHLHAYDDILDEYLECRRKFSVLRPQTGG
jgi:lipopolysaccharide biosynthesis glycosyltransferase